MLVESERVFQLESREVAPKRDIHTLTRDLNTLKNRPIYSEKRIEPREGILQ